MTTIPQEVICAAIDRIVELETGAIVKTEKVGPLVESTHHEFTYLSGHIVQTPTMFRTLQVVATGQVFPNTDEGSAAFTIEYRWTSFDGGRNGITIAHVSIKGDMIQYRSKVSGDDEIKTITLVECAL